MKISAQNFMPMIKLHFPFSIDSRDGQKDRISLLDTEVVRVQEHVSFSIPYDLLLNVEDATLRTKEHKKNAVIYVFEFTDLDSAISWMEGKTAQVEMRPRNGDLYKIQNEMNSFMAAYENQEGRVKRKRQIEDEDGFVYYD